jgi:hypothetical protein
MVFSLSKTGVLSFDDTILKFGDTRSEIRLKLVSHKYTEENEVIDLSTSIQELVMEERKDIYEECTCEMDFFTLKYNKEDLLNEVEVHYVERIKVEESEFTFNEDIDTIATILSSTDDEIEKREGEYIFRGLKAVIWNREKIGSEGNELGYFYCSSDISHLR